MAKTKYGKYIITQKPKASMHPSSITTVQCDTDKIQGAFSLLCELVTKKFPDNAPQYKPHYHDYDEYLVFLGTDPEDAANLGGEIEIWLGDEEKHTLTKSSAVFVPKGLIHTPIEFKRVDKPIMMLRVANVLKQGNFHYSKDPKWANIPEPPAEDFSK